MNIALNKYGRLALWIVAFLAISGTIGQITNDDVQTWYRDLAKPPLNPPDFVFPLVWTTLYIMIAVAGWILWNKRNEKSGRLCITLFFIQCAMNWAWSFIFFEAHMLGLAFAWLLFLIALVAILILKSSDHARLAAALLFPYLLWIGFASYLSGSVWLLN